MSMSCGLIAKGNKVYRLILEGPIFLVLTVKRLILKKLFYGQSILRVLGLNGLTLKKLNYWEQIFVELTFKV